jgi:hypothetical protein
LPLATDHRFFTQAEPHLSTSYTSNTSPSIDSTRLASAFVSLARTLGRIVMTRTLVPAWTGDPCRSLVASIHEAASLRWRWPPGGHYPPSTCFQPDRPHVRFWPIADMPKSAPDPKRTNGKLYGANVPARMISLIRMSRRTSDWRRAL